MKTLKDLKAGEKGIVKKINVNGAVHRREGFPIWDS